MSTISKLSDVDEFYNYVHYEIKEKERAKIIIERDTKILKIVAVLVGMITITCCSGIIYYNLPNSAKLIGGLVASSMALLALLYYYMIYNNYKNTDDHEIIRNKVHIEIDSPAKLMSEGWNLSASIDEIANNLALGLHIGIIGRFKSGKSTLIGLLSDEPLDLGDEVSNTRGIDMYKLKVNGKDVIARDTEGLFQILGVEDPYFRRSIITNMLKESCSHLIVIFESITTQDRPLLDQIVGLMVNSSNVDRVTICHNVKSIKSVDRLREYATNLCKCIKIPLDANTLLARHEVMIDRNDGNDNNGITKVVNHLFLCDFEAEPQHNFAQISHLKTLVSGTTETRVNLTQSLHTSICSTLIRQFDQVNPTHLTITNNYVKYTGVLKKKHGVIGDSLNRAINIKRFIAPPKSRDNDDSLEQTESKDNNNSLEQTESKENNDSLEQTESKENNDSFDDIRLRYVIDAGGITKDSIDIDVLDQSRIKVKIEKHDEELNVTNSITEYIDLPWPLNRSVHRKKVKTVGVSANHSIYFDVTLNLLEEERQTLESLMRLSSAI